MKKVRVVCHQTTVGFRVKTPVYVSGYDGLITRICVSGYHDLITRMCVSSDKGTILYEGQRTFAGTQPDPRTRLFAV